jgi:hypothetical protein
MGIRFIVEHDEAEDRGRFPERLDRFSSLLLRTSNRILPITGIYMLDHDVSIF